MDSQLGEAFVPIRATLDKLDGDLKQARSKIEGALGTVSANVQKIGGLALTGAAAGILGIGAALGAVGAQSFTLSQDLSDGMRQFQAQTGAADAEMQGFRDTALDIFNSNWGDSLADVADSMATVKQITGETGEALEETTTNALIMRDVFDKDIPESVRAVDTAVEVFGGDATGVFDRITATIQSVGDPADDLLDTVNEYSTVFGQAGFSADQMFGVLEAGLENGARNFDVVADAVKEFNIRILDGSETTEDALNALFNAVGEGNQELSTLKSELDLASQALEENKQAVDEAEGAYEASKSVVDDLSRALSDARRELNELSRPNLAGMEDFDDRLFELEQQSKQAKLALLDLEPDTDAYKAVQQTLDDLNKEIDRVTLQRDLTFDRQLREIEQAATDGLEPVLTFDEAMAQIGEKKAKIAELGNAFNAATGEMEQNAARVKYLRDINEELTSRIDWLKSSIEEADNPAKEFLAGFTDGSLTGADAMSQVIQKLQEVKDPLLRNQIGVALFGTLWEDLGANIILALDPAKAAIGEFDGATAAAGETVSGGLGPAWSSFKRNALTALIPVGDSLSGLAGKVLNVAEGALPKIQEVLDTYVTPAVETVTGVIGSFITNLQEGQAPLDAFIGAIEGLAPPGVVDFLVSLRDEILPGLSAWFAENVQPVVDMATEFVSWKDILIALGIAIAAVVLPALYGIVTAAAPVIATGLALVAIISLARNAWENDWGGIRSAVAGAIDYLEPYWERLKEALNEFWQELVPALKEVWQTLVEVWQSELQPALAELWVALQDLFEALGFGVEDTDYLAAALGLLKIALAFVLFYVEMLSPTIKFFAGRVKEAVDQVKMIVEFLTSMKRAVDAAIEPFKRLAGKIGDLIEKATGLPDWLIPGSPTPFERGLRGIGQAINAMPDLEFNIPALSLGVNGGELAAAAGGPVGPVEIRIDGAQEPQAVARAVRTELERLFGQARR